MCKELSRVYFDGNEISFKVNNIEVVNGEFPSEFRMDGDYLIRAEDLAMITAILSEKKGVYREVDCLGSSTKVFIKDEEDLKEMIQYKQKEIRILEKRYYELGEQIRNIKYEIGVYNNIPWYKRILTKIKLDE